jgi:hypothetical protein
MIIRAKWSGLKQSRWYEYLVRFGLGGIATVLAGAIAKRFGPELGGVFLAFPAIFCASVTLIEKHERDRKKKLGLDGFRRGTDAAALDAAGAVLGSLGLLIFGFVVWVFVKRGIYVTLMGASGAWLLISVSLWGLRTKFRHLSIFTKYRTKAGAWQL